MASDFDRTRYELVCLQLTLYYRYADFTPEDANRSFIRNEKALDSCFPPEFFPIIADDLNGDFFCEYDLDEQDEITKHGSSLPVLNSHPIRAPNIGRITVSWSCFKIKHAVKPGEYEWFQPAVFVQWLPQKHQQLVFFLNLPKPVKEYLEEHRPLARNSRGNPYVWHTVFAQAIIEDYDKSIWSLRDLVRHIEKARNFPHPPALNFPNLHDIARHIFHSNETLNVAAQILESLIAEQKSFQKEYPALVKGNRGSWSQNGQRAKRVKRQLQSLAFRSQSLGERLHNEINLAFNLVSQKDGAMMKTVAIVSMVYLPGTFISVRCALPLVDRTWVAGCVGGKADQKQGLFGTNFFNMSNDPAAPAWMVSANFWLYWAIAVPLTCATMAIWALWHYFPHYYPRIALRHMVPPKEGSKV
ncbi:uncharacterized protein ACLA_013010 [Aspergillus clavatus NRRL 1]|uniref:Uncharacterized protein n=1 Tax=Aspergillus clavatus (strain ATCC 1007 / CBS 513.65 / DSM 816 / NCTC 3887 / NRRL 1 / QM 1276 / 107) TaxID=344612 RepID=A1CAV2_ASPCL|nr:uncharacterized protein ACLA_013010 [Aspergillus clavatus NRRL 1]EAW12870.1 conserved hypothetical protein [Aspergillus clavatus NRRL 1]